MHNLTSQPLTVQVAVLLVLSAVVACISWTVTHEELFREFHEACVKRSRTARHIVWRKLFYMLTCEYCFSHYVSAGVALGTGYRLLIDDWRGLVIAVFVLVWLANFQMSAYARLHLEVKLDRIEVEAKDEAAGTAAAPSSPKRRSTT